MNARRKLGQRGEDMARKHLQKHGYRILEKNFRTRLGEIDIVARDGDSLVFVEVKTRRSGRYGSPGLSITPQKQKKLSVTALSYLKQTRQTEAKARFDVVLIQAGSNGTPEIKTIQNAFPLCYG